MNEAYEKLYNKLKPEKLEAERQRIASMKEHEIKALSEGYDHVLGVDEVGRGPLCGPVVTACCVLDPDKELLFLNDSKKLSEKKREIMAETIGEEALCYAFGESSPKLIDEINILQATKQAMRSAIEACYEKLCSLSEGARPKVLVLIDGNQIIPGLCLPQQCIIKGDASSVSIAAASILAKVRRDHMMEEYDKQYPGYGFAKNKGYGTREHLEALESMGPTPIHRMSFVPRSKTAVGLHYEKLAAKLLKLSGYELICENYRTRDGEIDIVAAKDGILCFTEVKYRSSEEYGHPSEAVDRKKQERIYRSALHYLSDPEAVKTDASGKVLSMYRFDIVEIEGEKYRILENAFSRPGRFKDSYFV